MAVDFTPDPKLYPFTSRWFDSSRGRMHYIDEGPAGFKGPPLVMCHGNPTWSFLYRNVVIALRDQFRCIAPDYLGFGLSERPAGFGYTAAEHAQVLGELIDHLNLDGYLSMGQDWGGPISLAAAVDRADRVAGVILGNTWFWPADPLAMKVFSAAMSSPPLQYAILQHNFFVNRLMPPAACRLTPEVMAHYRGVQPAPADRVGVARFPKEIVAARPLLQRLVEQVPARLGSKPALIVWGMRDPAFKSGAMIARVRAAFDDHVFVELPHAKHFIQEDAPDEIARAIVDRFG